MSIYNINRKALNVAYGISGNAMTTLFDISGKKIILSENSLLDGAMLYCNEYLKANPNAYAFPLVTDAHLTFKGEEPKYIEQKYPDIWSIFVFLGDMVNCASSYNETELIDAVNYMSGCSKMNKLVAIGNHELGNWSSEYPLPEEYYKPMLDSSAVLWGGGDGLIYYSDDEVNGIRYIVLDSSTPVYKANGVQKYPKNELAWCASAIESAADKDIIIFNHTMGRGHYLISDTEKQNYKSSTTITNTNILTNMIKAFINKESYSFTNDDGVANTYNFNNCTGNFVGFITGHEHVIGYNNDDGFNMLTCPMTRVKYSGYIQAVSFFIIDKALRKIIWVVCDYSKTTHDIYEFTY